MPTGAAASPSLACPPDTGHMHVDRCRPAWPALRTLATHMPTGAARPGLAPNPGHTHAHRRCRLTGCSHPWGNPSIPFPSVFSSDPGAHCCAPEGSGQWPRWSLCGALGFIPPAWSIRRSLRGMKQRMEDRVLFLPVTLFQIDRAFKNAYFTFLKILSEKASPGSWDTAGGAAVGLRHRGCLLAVPRGRRGGLQHWASRCPWETWA